VVRGTPMAKREDSDAFYILNKEWNRKKVRSFVCRLQSVLIYGFLHTKKTKNTNSTPDSWPNSSKYGFELAKMIEGDGSIYLRVDRPTELLK
jgi:hypothetical protein